MNISKNLINGLKKYKKKGVSNQIFNIREQKSIKKQLEKIIKIESEFPDLIQKLK